MGSDQPREAGNEVGRPYGGVYRSPAAAPSGTVFALLSTERGDIVALLDGAGAAFAGYRYDEWGNPLGEGNVATGIWTQQTTLISADLASQMAARQILRYAGYAYDAESGLYYCSARYYDPVTRQFISKDEAKADGEESAYQYCGGEPVGKVDAAGAWPDWVDSTNWEEKKLFLKNPVWAYVCYKDNLWAKERTREMMAAGYLPKTGWANYKPDAFRHAIWSAAVSQDTSRKWAREAGNAHEATSLTKRQRRMDLYNNWLGRRFQFENPAMSMKSWLASVTLARDGRLRWFGHGV
jgi:RHS repeat-associated protein